MAHHITHNADLHRLLSSFHRDRPESSRNLPKWNLSVVLNELTKAPFEPMKDTDLKHVTLKTAFLLALASGKRRSEIHAWVANKISNLGQILPLRPVVLGKKRGGGGGGGGGTSATTKPSGV